MNNKEATKKWQEKEALKRFQIIAPLLEDELDPAKKQQLREETAQTHHLSVRSLYRYEKAYRCHEFSGLKPMNRDRRRSKNLPENFDELVVEAIQLKREVPTRSVAQILLVLELEGRIPPGRLKRSTLQRHLYDAGFGKKQMRKYNEARRSSSKRFCKPHRMMLIEADLKNGPKLPIGKNGAMVQTCLCVLIDNHSRLVLDAKFHDNQNGEIVEDSYRRAILKYGKMSAVLHDNGGQFVSTQLVRSFSILGIRLLRAKPYSPQSKGGVEVFNRSVNAFLAEAKAQKVKDLEQLNHFWDIWLEEYYHNKPHEGIAEYYKSLGSPVPAEGISPRQEWNRDSRPLVFLDAGVVGKAFLHHETRVVDKGACISFNGLKYETSTSLIGATVEIAYDPMDSDIITVTYPGIEPMKVGPIRIGEFCDPKPEIPLCMLPEEPEVSRFLQGLEQRHETRRRLTADALSFGNYRKEGHRDV